MGQRMRDALGKLLDDYDRRKRGDAERLQKAKDDETLFLSQFAALRKDVIRPVLESAAAMLEERGHRCHISEVEFAAGAQGRISEAGISLRVVAAGTKPGLHEDQKALTFTTRHYNRTIWINTGESPESGGIAGAKGAHALETVTSQLVEDEVISFVERLVAA